MKRAAVLPSLGGAPCSGSSRVVTLQLTRAHRPMAPTSRGTIGNDVESGLDGSGGAGEKKGGKDGRMTLVIQGVGSALILW